MKNFVDMEGLCSQLFFNLGDCWHLWTPENFPLIFTCEQEFKDGMSIMALSISEFPDISCYTFELMNNHIHVCLSGKEERVKESFETFRHFLRNYLRSRGRYPDLSGFRCGLRRIDSLEEMRNVVIYVNRNGFVVSPDETPFSYPWGANAYYYNRQAKSRCAESSIRFTTREALNIIHSKAGQYKKPLRQIDGYISPLSFCKIDLAERLFRNASHYFYLLTKKMEQQKEIALQIGESIFYNDNELYQIALTLSKKQHGVLPALLNVEAKIELAKKLRYDYNASSKQIQRILKLDASLLVSLGLSDNKADRL